MKRINILKTLLCVTMLGGVGIAQAQIKPLNFYGAGANWFSNYVGVRVGVTDPTGNPTLGDKQYTITNDGITTGGWAAAVVTPVVDVPIVMVGVGGDTVVSTSLPVGSMAGKIAFIYRGVSEFGHKAAQAKAAGAVACVIVNNVVGGPIGMGAGSEGGAIPLTQVLGGIPVVMISKEDGDAIDAQYRAGVVIKMTLTNWGSGAVNDIGFVPGGTSMWHSYAIPANQLATAGTANAYKVVDGAFIANYGSANATGVNLTSELMFTPSAGGSPVSLHTSTVTLGNFPVADSVWGMFDISTTATNVYSLPAGTGTGRYDQNYTINTATDDYLGNNTATSSFYATDSLYSKGRFDFANSKPYSTQYFGEPTTAPLEFIWGDMYYVNTGGAAVRKVQYSLSLNTTTAATLIDVPSTDLYLFKWVDANANNIVELGEMQIVGLATHQYNTSSPSLGDTSGGNFAATEWKAVGSKTGADYVTLESNTWYYLAVDVKENYYLGCDGVLDQYPRIFGHEHSKVNQYLEYSNMKLEGGDSATITQGTPTDSLRVLPFTQVLTVQAVDSFTFNQAKGIIPSLAMTVNNSPSPKDHTGVKPLNKTSIGVNVFPNPATNSITVALDMDNTAAKVTYTVIDGLARFMSSESSVNVKSEKHTINTSRFPSGNYDLVITTSDGSSTVTKFTIVK